MTETSHTRSRRVSFYGLVLQVVAFVGVLLLAQVVRSASMEVLAWFLAGGLFIWFAALLLFRQKELAALEAMDLEELRREKQATGGGEALFDEEGGGALGFRVAEARLQWMQRWLVPAFGLAYALFLAGLGIYLWYRLRPLDSPDWPELTELPIAMIVLTVAMILFFLSGRYASGMGRVREWQLLRACGSYMLGNALAMLAVFVCFGVKVYAKTATPEHVLAYVLCGVMLVLAAETIVSFVLDIYRPRVPDTEPRACFDSRLLALISEPGGIASTIAEALNYQFGFEVSQTWFYQLLQRTFVPLMGVGLLILWLLSCLLVVEPGEHAIIERFGTQLNADRPYPPGFYWKLPWPIDVARKYDTGRLHHVVIGFKQFDARPQEETKMVAALWTDERHWGQPHFNLLVPVPPATEEERPAPAAATQPAGTEEEAWPVNIVRMDVAVQYKIDEERLAEYTQSCVEADRAILDMAWEEVVRYAASWDIFSLLGEKYGAAGAELRRRIEQRIEQAGLGLQVVYVGVQNVHPDPNVAKEFRKVVSAEQEKIAAIRQALVKENEILSAVAGDRDKARELAQAIAHINPHTLRRDQAQVVLEELAPEVRARWEERFRGLEPRFRDVIVARWRLEQARQQHEQIELDFELGLGRTVAERESAADAVQAAEAELARAEAALAQALRPLESAARRELDPGAVQALRDHAEASFALAFWNGRLEELLPGLQGEAAAELARAQAERWAIELGAAEELARVQGERGAWRVAPRIYKVRKYLDVLVDGLKDARKFFLAFDPGEREVRVRFLTQEQMRADEVNFPSRLEEMP